MYWQGQWPSLNKIGATMLYGILLDEINHSSLMAFITITYWCLKRDREVHPSMTAIVRMLATAFKYQVCCTYFQHDVFLVYIFPTWDIFLPKMFLFLFCPLKMTMFMYFQHDIFLVYINNVYFTLLIFSNVMLFLVKFS